MPALPYTETFSVRAYEVDVSSRVTVQNICNYMQEIAGLHAAELGVGIERMLHEGVTWVLARLQVALEELPRDGEKLTMQTWPVRIEGIQFRRDFIATREDGTVAARGISHWAIVNLASRRVVRVPSFINQADFTRDVEAMQDSTVRVDALITEEEACRFQVRLADIDRNLHVNNVRYLDWILESVPEQTREHSPLRYVELLFRAEAFPRDNIAAYIMPLNALEDGGDHFVHSLVRVSDDKELVRARTLWHNANRP